MKALCLEHHSTPCTTTLCTSAHYSHRPPNPPNHISGTLFRTVISSTPHLFLCQALANPRRTCIKFHIVCERSESPTLCRSLRLCQASHCSEWTRKPRFFSARCTLPVTRAATPHVAAAAQPHRVCKGSDPSARIVVKRPIVAVFGLGAQKSGVVDDAGRSGRSTKVLCAAFPFMYIQAFY